MDEETKKSTKKEFTHYIVAVPHPEGTYKDPDGRRVNLHKIKKSRTVATRHPTFKGTTIKDFVKSTDFTKA